MPATRRVALIALGVAGPLLLGGCFTGERPTLQPPAVGGEVGTPTGDSGADDVLTRLEQTTRGSFTAGYTITRLLDSVVTPARVSQDATRTSVTVGDVRFLAETDQTCDLSAKSCESGMRDNLISDTGVSHEFYDAAAARRLRIALTRATAPTTTRTETIAGYPSSCVDVPLGAGTETYCANDLGVVARWLAADVTVELDAISPSPTEELFSSAA